MSLLAEMKHTDQDFEWYPTTTEIIDCIKQHVSSSVYAYRHKPSVLDCGAGDGRVLDALTEGERYAIEKSIPALNTLDADIAIVGTDFHQQTLIDKRVDVVFSNPPYSEYARWSTKIILEANASVIFLVIPSRWKDNGDIRNALTRRDVEASVIGSYDFLNAERQARASVDVIMINLQRAKAADPFKVWFEDNFKVATPKTAESTLSETKKTEDYHTLVHSDGLLDSLVRFYERDLAHLMHNYQKLAEMDADLLAALNVNVESARQALQLKIKGLKNEYWHELFSNLNTLTERLTADTRRDMQTRLFERTDVDFTYDNAHAIVLWAIKNTNHYLDKQFLSVTDKLISRANTTLYKSNQRLFIQDDWRYRHEATHYTLETRCVLTMRVSEMFNLYRPTEIDRGVAEYLDDLLVVAAQLGFDTRNTARALTYTWQAGKATIFTYERDGNTKTLFEVKAFKNGNLHIKFDQSLMLKINVELGKLRGWVKTAQECASEFTGDMTADAINDAFVNDYHVTTKNPLLLLNAS